MTSWVDVVVAAPPLRTGASPAKNAVVPVTEVLIGGKLLPVRNRPKALNVFDAGTLDLDPRWHRGAAFYLDFDGGTVARPQRRDTLAA